MAKTHCPFCGQETTLLPRHLGRCEEAQQTRPSHRND